MEFAALAAAFREIEAQSSRIRVTTRLAELFRSAPGDAGILPYLLQGQLGPPYAAPDLGLDEQRIALALATAARVPIAEIERLYDQQGDLGLVAESLLAPSSGPGPTVREVYDRLRLIAATVGIGSAVEKVRLLRDLLGRTGGDTARYLIRIVEGRLRLGVGDATVLDALSIVSAGNLSARPRIARAYGLCADLGVVADRLLSGGLSALDEIHPTPGRPVLPALAGRLPSASEVIRRLGPVIAEPKYDGLRLQAHKDGDRVWLFTRRLEEVTGAFPEIVGAVRGQVAAHQAILDGEAVGYEPRTGAFLPFQQTARRRRKYRIAELEASFPLRYYLFDLLLLDGQDLTSAPQRQRSGLLDSIVRSEPSAAIDVAPRVETDNPRELEVFVAEMLRRGLEGAVAKRPDAPYEAGTRGLHWVKLKREHGESLLDTFDLVVLGYDRGRGRRARLGIGSLLCGVYDPERDRFRTVSRVGSGLTDDEWLRLREMLDASATPARPSPVDSLVEPDVWVEPRYVLEVVAGEIIRSPRHTCGMENGQPGYALRFPRVSGFRFDRRPVDATTQAEVVELYRLQRARSTGDIFPTGYDAATGSTRPDRAER